MGLELVTGVQAKEFEGRLITVRNMGSISFWRVLSRSAEARSAVMGRHIARPSPGTRGVKDYRGVADDEQKNKG